MEISEILKYCDHTILSTTASWEDVKKVLDEACAFNTASACIPPSFVKRAKNYVQDKLKICTVIGFPNGYNTINSKALETEQAVLDGADEIDVVINVGELKSGNVNYVASELSAVRKACVGKVLKVIVEACLLTEEEKITACRLVTDCKAEYIKTSTGFSSGGATFEDVELFKEYIGKEVKIKAAGGIRSIESAEKFIEIGCSRLGTSALVKIAKQQ